MQVLEGCAREYYGDPIWANYRSAKSALIQRLEAFWLP